MSVTCDVSYVLSQSFHYDISNFTKKAENSLFGWGMSFNKKIDHLFLSGKLANGNIKSDVNTTKVTEVVRGLIPVPRRTNTNRNRNHMEKSQHL